MNRYTGEKLEIVDALYDLQRMREIYGFGTEYAVIDGRLYEDCSVFYDIRTENMTTITPLPGDMQNFRDAYVHISNPSGETPVVIKGKEVIRPDLTIHFGGGEIWQKGIKGEGKRSRRYEASDLLSMLSFPKVNLVPVSANDDREVPHNSPYSLETGQYDNDILSVPGIDSYTLCSKIYDENGTGDRVFTLKGLIIHKDNPVSYRMHLTELPADKGMDRISDFDRNFVLLVSTDSKISLDASPLGQQSTKVSSKVFIFQIIREGSVLMLRNHDRNMHCIPGSETSKFVDDLLANSTLENPTA